MAAAKLEPNPHITSPNRPFAFTRSCYLTLADDGQYIKAEVQNSAWACFTRPRGAVPGCAQNLALRVGNCMVQYLYLVYRLDLTVGSTELLAVCIFSRNGGTSRILTAEPHVDALVHYATIPMPMAAPSMCVPSAGQAHRTRRYSHAECQWTNHSHNSETFSQGLRGFGYLGFSDSRLDTLFLFSSSRGCLSLLI